MKRVSLQTLADLFDMAIVKNKSGAFYGFEQKPERHDCAWFNGGVSVKFDERLIEANVDWRESLTLPDSWPKEPKFKEGELVYGTDNSGPYIMTSDRMINSAWYRKPTKKEWKTLRGEE